MREGRETVPWAQGVSGNSQGEARAWQAHASPTAGPSRLPEAACGGTLLCVVLTRGAAMSSLEASGADSSH